MNCYEVTELTKFYPRQALTVEEGAGRRAGGALTHPDTDKLPPGAPGMCEVWGSLA